jgi:hypothetical protein
MSTVGARLGSAVAAGNGLGGPASPGPAGPVSTLSAAERAATLDSIAAVQHASGFVPHAPGRDGDPWNHLEAAMALVSGGRIEEADRAISWSLRTQRRDGSWPAELDCSGAARTARVDTNCVAYLAVAVWHRFLATADRSAAARAFPAVDRALRFVLGHEQPGGGVSWERDASGRRGAYALVAASSSIHHALLAGAALAERTGICRPDYVAAAERLARALAGHLAGTAPANFADKSDFAMDWYYPVLGGVLGPAASLRRLDEARARFVVEGLGVRCRAGQGWVTTAETAECALAHARAGEHVTATALLAATRHQRCDDGSYLTGLVHPGGNEFPPGERTTYSAAAVLLTEDALAGGPASATFGCVRPASGGGAVEIS